MIRVLAILFVIFALLCGAYEIVRLWPAEKIRVLWVEIPILAFLMIVLVQMLCRKRNPHNKK
ncbi:MAG: hypothetical protein WHS88_12630 [Anaerohalosphaeraceae bacterium]